MDDEDTVDALVQKCVDLEVRPHLSLYGGVLYNALVGYKGSYSSEHIADGLIHQLDDVTLVTALGKAVCARACALIRFCNAE